MSVSWTKLKLLPPSKAKEGAAPPKDDLSAADIVAYLADAQAGGDYYSESDQALMMWHATDRAAVELGIIAESGQPYWRQPVRRAALADLLAGRNPRTGKAFRRAGGDGTRVAAIDVTMSPAPKSVSILWALGSKELRKELELMVAKASDRAMVRMLEEQPFLRRVVKGKLENQQAQDYIAVSALHTTARMSAKGRGVPDPQLHLHYLLLGALDETGWMRALDSKTLADYQAELSAEASGHLAEMLHQRGFEIERRLEYRKDKKGTERPRVFWEVVGVPKSLIQAMSSRTMEIAELKQRFMKEYGREPVGRAWDAWVVKQRGPKAKLTSLELLLAWVEEAEEHGFGPEAVRALARAADLRQAMGGPERDRDSPEAQEFRELVMAHVCREHAFIEEAQLFSLAHQLAVGLIPPRQVLKVLIRMVEDYDLLLTVPDRKVTTLEVLQWEQRSMDGARRLLAAPRLAAVPAELIEAELARREAEGKPFDEHQAEAVRVAVGGARFVSITGPAGTGKGVASNSITTLFRESAIRVLEQAGRRVIALAVPGRTAQQAGVDADADLAMTINSLEFRVGVGNLQLSEHDVLLVDEAGMIDHSRYAALLEAAADAAVTVVQVGDDKQLAPVGPGGLWTSTHQLAEAAGTAAELRVVRRALDHATAQAWTNLAAGRVAAALTHFRDIGLLRLYDTRVELREAMVADWWAAGAERGLMIVDTSNDERDLLNQLAQNKRLEAGLIGSEALPLEADGRELHVGDEVLFTAIYRPEPAGGRRVKRVENGTPAVVMAVDLHGEQVQLELDEPVKETDGEVPPRRRLWVGKDVPVELAYARHVMKAQGVTTDTADIAVSLRSHLNELYVMVSRPREGARIHALGVEMEELAEEEAELRAELEADRAQQLELEGLDAQQAEERGGRAAELLTKQQDATIAEIERRATPSTKEAVGDRPIGQAEDSTPVWTGADDRQEVVVVRQDLKRDDLMIPQLAALPVPTPEPDLASLQLADGQVLSRGDVVRFQDPASLAGRSGEEVQPGDLGVVLGCHRGGITWNYATAQLVGGRQIEVWQTAEGVEVEADLPPSIVQEAVPRPDQRDPTSLGVLELQNGARLMRGDQVQLTQPATLDRAGLLPAGTLARVDDIERHQHNRAVVQLEDGRRANVYSGAPLAIVQPAEEARLGPGAEPVADPETERAAEPVQVLPASDQRETLAREYFAAPDTARALGYLQIAGRLEYSQNPMTRAVERLAEDPEAVLVVSRGQQGRAMAELGKQPELEADVRERGRLVLADDAYEQRLEQREGEQAAGQGRAGTAPEVGGLEDGVPLIQRGIVVAEEPWATPELARAMSVAGESHLVTRSPGRLMEEKVLAVVDQHRQAEQTASLEPNRAAEERVRELAHEHSLEADLAPGPERSAQRGAAEVEHSGAELER